MARLALPLLMGSGSIISTKNKSSDMMKALLRPLMK